MTLMEIMIAMIILTVAFSPIMNFFSYNFNSRKVRLRNIGVSLAKNGLDFFIEDTPFHALNFNIAVPDFENKNVDAKCVVCIDQTNQIFNVLGASYKSKNGSIPDGGLSGEIDRQDDKQKFWLKILANPFIDSSATVTPATELVFNTLNWDRNQLNWFPQQSLMHHVINDNACKTYLDLLGDPNFQKQKRWDGRAMNPVANSQGLVVPMCKAMIRARWIYGRKEQEVFLESYKANLVGRSLR